ncbi:MAG: sensor domain-containing diguanylate cyclase [Rhodanobacteraceae bacterium]|nr:sensor domain-containing diguanylate cyclase [Rhodanobacteraceae bacterium]
MPQVEQRSAQQLATVNRIARIAIEDLELRPMLQRIVDTLKVEYGWEFVACATIDQADGSFVCEAVAGELESEVKVGYRRALGSGVVGRCAATGQTFDIEDARNHPEVIDTLNGTGSELCVPVVHRGEVLAVLNAESRAVGAFRGQRALLETVADQIAGVLRAARLHAELQRAHAQLQSAYRTLDGIARRDSLTGLGNRRWFDERLRERMARTRTDDQPLALLLFDVDHFKAYNDHYGHPAGDACLRVLGALTAGLFDVGEQRAARYGGEEFTVILTGADAVAAMDRAEQLRAMIEARALPHARAPLGRVTISIGAARLRPGEDAQSLITRCDAALYAAKGAGRNHVSGND